MKPSSDYKKLGFPNREMFTFPNIVNVEVYRGSCPCYCHHCPVGKQKKIDRVDFFGKRSISTTLYEKIINEAANYSHSSIRLHSVGEPLDSPNIGELLELHKDEVIFWLFTCGVTEDKNLIKLLCQKVNIIEVSVNSTNREDYLNTKGIDAFSLVKENIELMRDYIDLYGSNSRLIVSRVQSKSVEMDNEFIDYWKASGLVEDAIVRSYHTYNNIIDPLSQNSQINSHEPCLVHWGRFNITVDGFATVCFNELFRKELNPEIILGNINNQSIAKVWKGSLLNSIRKAELSGEYPETKLFANLPCKNCYTCQPLTGSNQTSEYQLRRKGEMK